MTPWLSIVGVGEDGLGGLGPEARTRIDEAEVLVGAERHLALVENGPAERFSWASPLSATVERLAGLRGRRVCVLATGDPMAYGIGVTLVRRFGADAVRVLPGLSAFCLARARLGWPLAETVELTLHGRPIELVLAHLVPGGRLLLLSEDGTTPARVAELLAGAGYGPSRLHVLCRMGGSRERRIATTAAAGLAARVDDLNTIAVELEAGPGAPPPGRGLPDDAFRHDGQITKREVRAVTLAALAPAPGALLWDVGAGCGSVAIEWMRAAPRARAVAVERHEARRATIARNALALGAPELEIVAGSAPAALAGLEPPEAVFVGGGATADGMIAACWDALPGGGRLVANAVTLESETVLMAEHAERGGELSRLAVSRAEPVGAMTGWRAMTPVTQWRARKP